jgi:L-lactate dehydrogenase complex protein LldG
MSDTGRDRIFGKIRKALGPVADDPGRRAAVAAHIAERRRSPTPGRVAGKSAADLTTLLKTQLATALATVISVPNAEDVPAAIAGYLRTHNLPSRIRIGADETLARMPWGATTALDVRHGRAEPGDEVTVSHAVAAVAETGTLALASGPDNPVTLTFLPETHIVVVDASAVVGPYEDVWDRLRQQYGTGSMPRTLNFVSGPSRTADIGGKIVIGAHGPRRLCVVLVGTAG